MKKLMLFLYVVLNGITVIAQDTIPNAGFEGWTTATYDVPSYYPQSSNPQAFFKCHTAFNVTQTTDAYHGTYALQLTTNASSIDTCGGYILNATNANGNPSTWTGGIAYNQQPLGIRGYYKYNVATNDSALIIAIFKLAGNPIGVYMYLIGGVQTTYTLFDFTFNPPLPFAPDTVIFAAASSNLIASSGMPGSTLILDSVSFWGAGGQPNSMNGDFETWSSTTVEFPDSWYNEFGQGEGVLKTPDRHTGNYAVEIQTYLGDNNGSPVAQSGNVSTGYFDNGCLCLQGGSTFSNTVDTLAFYYKYVPANASDSALVSLTFKQNGSMIGGTMMNLPPAASYQLAQLPFSLGSTPDTVVVSLNSSMWNDTALSFIGADFKVDDLHFKAPLSTVGIHETVRDANDVRLYPNPFRTFATIEIDPNIQIGEMVLQLYDVFGRVIRKTVIDKHRITLEKNDLPGGVYFYELNNNSRILRTGKIVVE